jgi:hypothetical protein
MCFESGADHTEGACRRQSSLGRVRMDLRIPREDAEPRGEIKNALYYQFLSD